MPKLKSERHHWWPECVSKRWKNADGLVHRLAPDGSVRAVPPMSQGHIHNAHHIKLSPDPNEDSVWDETFEKQFQRADNSFTGVIDWLEGLDREQRHGRALSERFLAQPASDDELQSLVECIVSLAVRSPTHREAAVGTAEELRGPLPTRERNLLTALNMRRSLRMVADSIGSRGKFAVIFSPEREFIFGDGFFHNITVPVSAPVGPKMLVPLTPEMSVLFVKPTHYREDPRLMTLVVNASEADILNRAVQVYAKESIFYRSECPAIVEDFQLGRHFIYADSTNPVDNLIRCIPGVFQHF